jgi:outer membrane biosynthesis protein TonB
LRTALKTAVGTWRAQGGNSSATAPWPAATNTNWTDAQTRQVWSQLQNLLLGNGYNGDPDPGPTYAFWWYADGHKPITNLEELLEAAWNSWGGPGGTAPSDSSDPNAMDALDETAANLKFITGVLNTDPSFRLDDLDFRKNDDGDAFDSVADFKTQLKNAVQTIKGVLNNKQFFKDRTWEELQYVLINNGFMSAEDIAANSAINYWWKDGGAKPTGPSVDYTWANNSVKALTEYASGLFMTTMSVTGADIINGMPALTDTMARALNLCNSTGVPLTRQQLADNIAQAITDYYTDYMTNGSGGDWDALLNTGTFNLELNWASLQQWLLDGTRQNITPTDLPPTCTWTPSNDITGGVDYTAADIWVTALTNQASGFMMTSGMVTEADISGSVVNVAQDLDFRDSGGNQLSDADITSAIVNAVSGYYMDYMTSGSGGNWDTMLNVSTFCLELDWSSLQYWIASNQREALKGTSYEDMKDSYSIDWYPPNDPVAPGTFSLRPPMNALVIKPVEIEETTDVVTSEDGLRTTTTRTVTTTDFKAGTVEIRKEIEMVLTVGDKLVTTTDVYVTTVNMNTGEVTEAPAELGTPVITDAADIDTPELPEETEKPEETESPAETEKPEETEPPAETEKPEETEPPAETEKPEETEPPAETENLEGEEPGRGSEALEEGDVSGDRKEVESVPAEPPTEQKLTAKAEIEGETAMSTTIAAVQFPQSLYGIVIRQRERRLQRSMDSPLPAVLWGRGDYIGPSVDRPPIQRLRSPLLRLVSISQRDILTTGRTLI